MKVYIRLSPLNAGSHSGDRFLWKTEVADSLNIGHIIRQEIISDKIPYVKNDQMIRELTTDGLIIYDARFSLLSDAHMHVTVEGECIMMNFSLLNNGGLAAKQTAGMPASAYGKHNLQYLKALNHEKDLPKDFPYDTFCIFMSKDFYFRLIGKTNNLKINLAEVESMDTGLPGNYLPISYEMQNVINRIRNCTRKGTFHRLCLEIKLQELLLLQFEQHHDMVTKIVPRQSLHEDDEKKIRIAQTILEKNYSTPPTIQQLAKMVGVNEFKLKKDFKQIFHCTIHDYIVKFRMEKASQLVKEQHMQMKEIAINLGYKNPSHFSATFKRYYGYLPTEIFDVSK